MTPTETLRGVPGILRPFKEYLKDCNLEKGTQVVYYGCVGTCTPFVELLAVAIRGLHLRQVFVPILDESKSRTIVDVPDVGMQASGAPVAIHPGVIVVMGGLAMPMMPVTKEDVRALAERHAGAKVIGVCFQSMFEKAGWLDTVPFDLVINATIDPVVVSKRGD